MEAAPTAPDLFPPKPENVPPGLAKPTGRYRLHAWMAMLGLLIFAAIYVGLIAWFSWSSYRIFTTPRAEIFDFIKGGGAAILAIFLIKGLFFKKQSSGDKGFEITKQNQPRLFHFLHEVAKEAGAPKPHKVYLSPAVNASVFYDLSLLNFLFPTRKNLEIGLSLVNVLTLSEFKAVLAHEFGHFAQRSMAVGRWVYTAQQVATQLIYHRDALDKFLGFLSNIDLRVAWIGWILRLVVWSLRSILDTLLQFVMLAERALSREMEFQADLVAVSTTGSDALIHGLHRLGAADQAWEEAKDIMTEQLKSGKVIEDVFAVQTRVLEYQRWVLNDPEFGEVPQLPDEGRENHRIFTADIAQPPQMWATHPHSHLREANAKKTYVPAQLDDRSAWEIFNNPEQLRRELSAYLFEDLKEHDLQPMGETMAAVEKEYSKQFYNPAYRGVYLGRSVVAYAGKADDLYSQQGAISPDELYQPWLTERIEKMRNLAKEKALLEALRDRTYEPPDGQIRFRDERIRRSGLQDAVEIVGKELDECTEQLKEHDRKCRSYHLALAQQIGQGWDAYLFGVLSVLHFAEHSLRNLGDANGKLNNTFAVVVADGNVSSNELERLLGDARTIHSALAGVFKHQKEISIDAALAEKIGGEPWHSRWEDFQLGAPHQENIGDWLDALSGWFNLAMGNLSDLRIAALEQLLAAEAQVAEIASQQAANMPAPAPSAVPTLYPVLLPGAERELQTKLGAWDSFQTASGFFPATARFLVSFAIVAGAFFITFPPEWWAWLTGKN